MVFQFAQTYAYLHWVLAMLWALLFIDLFGLVTSDRDRMGWHNDIHQFPVGQVALSWVLGERLNQKLQQVSYILFFLTKQSSFGHCFSSFSHQPDTEKAPPKSKSQLMTCPDQVCLWDMVLIVN